MARSLEYVDLSHRMLAVTAWDQGLFQASFSTVYRVLKDHGLMSARAPGGAHNGNSKAPVRKELSGPNQRWCWDINDRGRQMKARPIQRLCEEHGMPQLFARPRTPNDNPFIESAFSTVKRAPEYPGRFLDDAQAVIYFTRYFTWYNNEHYHCGIDYVTPQQAHTGQRENILEQRRVKKLAQRRRRREENKKQKTGVQKSNQTITMTAPSVA